VPTSLLPSLVTGLGAPAAALRLIEGLANGASGLAKLVGGPLADDTRRTLQPEAIGADREVTNWLKAPNTLASRVWPA
jgi:hypothetical protein